MTRDRTIKFTCIPKSSSLFLDYLYDFPKVTPFFCNPFSLDSFKKEYGSLNSLDLTHRRELCDILEEQNRSFRAGARTFENISHLRNTDCFAVVTGQQVGLFTGPAYTIYKALTAVKLATHYSCRGVQAVPLFWMATEDHDVAEVNHCYVADGDGALHKVQYDTRIEDLQRPVGQIAFSDSIGNVVASFLETLPSSEFKGEIAERLTLCYRSENTFASAFGEIFSYLFSNYGLILIDPQDVRLKHLVRPFFRTVLQKSREFQDLLAARSQQLITSGYHAQVVIDEDATLFFLEEEGKRRALVREKDHFRAKGSDHLLTVKELLLIIQDSPQRISPNVILRPVTQDHLLPTLSYVAGPSEIAYLAQAGALYGELKRKMPVIFPRSSFSILEKKISKVLEKYRLSFCDLFEGNEAILKRIIENTLDQETAEKFGQIENSFAGMLAELESPLRKVDPTLVDALKTAQQKIQYQISHLRTKFIHAETKHDEIVIKQIEKTLAILFPQKTLQERRLNIFYFLARYGMDFLAQLYEEIDLTDPDHRLLYL